MSCLCATTSSTPWKGWAELRVHPGPWLAENPREAVLLLMSRGPALHLHLGLFINLLDFITPRESRQVGDLLTALHRGGG